MRLINADKLNLNLCNTVGDAKREIDGAETIDSIPTKWIKKWIKDCEYTDDYFIVCARGPIRKMIADWREEND